MSEEFYLDLSGAVIEDRPFLDDRGIETFKTFAEKNGELYELKFAIMEKNEERFKAMVLQVRSDFADKLDVLKGCGFTIGVSSKNEIRPDTLSIWQSVSKGDLSDEIQNYLSSLGVKL